MIAHPPTAAIDWPQLKTMVPNRSAILRILSSLLKLHQQTPTELNDAYANAEWDKVKDIAHKMRGTASLLAAPNLLSTSQAVEQQINESGVATSDRVLLLKSSILDLLNEAQSVVDGSPTT